jgi:hypothetical protein
VYIMVYINLQLSEQMLPQSPQTNAAQVNPRNVAAGQEGVLQPQQGFHPRMLVPQRPMGSPRLQTVGSGPYEGVIVSSGVAGVPSGLTSQPQQPQQHQQMMMPGAWFPSADFYRAGNRIRGPVPPPQASSARLMYQLPACGPPHPQQQQQQQQQQPLGQSHMPIMNSPSVQTMPAPLTLGQSAAPAVGQLPKVGMDDTVDKSDGDQFEDLIG